MPVTFVHPLAALPFRRVGLPTAALVAGALAPDLAYVLPIEVPRYMRHNIAGIFAFAAPVALFGLWLHYTFTAHALGALTSPQLAGIEAEFRFWPTRRLGALAVAAVVGAATHVLIDECTHYYGWVAKALPVLRDPVPLPWPEPIAGYKVLQYGLSAVGSVVVAWMSRHWLGQAWALTRDPERCRLIWAWAAFTTTASLLAAFAGASALEGWLQVRVFVVRLVVGLMGFGYGGLLGYGLWLRTRRSPPRGPSPRLRPSAHSRSEAAKRV